MKTLSLRLTAVMLIVFASLAGQAQSWTQLVSNCDSNLLDVCFVNSEIGYVSGVGGIVLKTVNGGTNWSAQNTGITDGLACIQFVDESHGFATGGFIGGPQMNATLIRTTDGGGTWTKIDVAPGKCGGGSRFLNSDTGFYAYADGLYGNSVIARTTDAGASWNVVYTGTGWISYFYFADPMHGYATVNNGTVLKTTDGGLNWTSLNLGASLWGSGIWFFDADKGIVGGRSGGSAAMFSTNDGGVTWVPVTSDNMIFKIFFADNTKGFALSVDESGAGKMIRSTDGGLSWADETTPKQNLRGIFFLNSNLGYAVGDDGVILKYAFPASVNDPGSESATPLLYPNPFSTSAIIRIPGGINADHVTLNVYNLSGDKTDLNVTTNKSDITIHRGTLPAGNYYYEIISGTTTVGKGTFILN